MPEKLPWWAWFIIIPVIIAGHIIRSQLTRGCRPNRYNRHRARKNTKKHHEKHRTNPPR